MKKFFKSFKVNSELSIGAIFNIITGLTGVISYTTMTIMLSSIGDVELLDVDFVTMLKVTFMIFCTTLLLLGVSILCLCYLPFCLRKFASFEKLDENSSESERLRRHQKTICSYWCLAGYTGLLILYISETVSTTKLSVIFVFMIIVYFLLPFLYDYIKLGKGAYSFGRKELINRFLRYSSSSFLVLFLFMYSSTFILLLFDIGEVTNAWNFLSCLFFLGGVSISFVNEGDSFEKLPIFFSGLILVFLISNAQHKVTENFLKKMRLSNYVAISAFFRTQSHCQQFIVKFGVKDEGKCDNNKLEFNAESPLLVISSFESKNHLLEYNSKRYRFRKDWIELNRQKIEKDQRDELWNHLSHLKFQSLGNQDF